MERITRWWRSRQQARVSTDNNFSRPGLRIAVIVIGIIILVTIFWGVLLGGRWVYRQFAGNDSAGKNTNQVEQGGDKIVENDKNQETNKDSTSSSDTNTLNDSKDTQPTPPPSTPTPTFVTPTVPRTGPEE